MTMMTGGSAKSVRRWWAVGVVILTVLAIITAALVVARRGEATAQITGYSATEPDTLVLHVETGPSDVILGAKVIEQTGAGVQVRVRMDRASSQPQVAVPRTVTLVLNRPLGDRAVYDETGTAVPVVR